MEETNGLLSLLRSLSSSPSHCCCVRAAHDFPKPHSQAACLQPSLNSIRFRKHPARSGTVSATEMPDAMRKGKQAGRQQTPESGRMTCRMLIHGVTTSLSLTPAFITPCPHSRPTPSSHVFTLPTKEVRRKEPVATAQIYSKCK